MKTLIFVSSVIDEFREERRIAKEVIEKYPFLEAWVFEREGASAGPLEEEYLQKVRECSVFIAIVGTAITEPVRKEFLEAKAHGKRILVLMKKLESRSHDVEQLISEVGAKYGVFESPASFEEALHRALDNEIRRALDEPLERLIPKRKESVLRELMVATKSVRVMPVFPQNQNTALYIVVEIGPEEVVLKKLASHYHISLPFEKVSVVPSVGGQPAIVQIDGRLQLLNAKRQWQFFPEYSIDPLGIAKSGTPGGADVEIFRAKLQDLGIQSQWNTASEATAANWSIAYDDDGRYFKCEGRMHRGSLEILVCSDREN
jgi:hypothetical protein